jgi:hypothetical protein
MKVERGEKQKQENQKSQQEAKQVVCLRVTSGDSPDYDHKLSVSSVLNFLNALSKRLARVVVESGLTHFGERNRGECGKEVFKQ